MMTFHLYDQNNDIYYFKTGYKNIDDFYPVMDDPEFEKFMDWMETGPMDQKPFCGVHDFQGDTYTCGYGSYEIQDYNLAISMWKEFLNNYTTTGEIKITKDYGVIII